MGQTHEHAVGAVDEHAVGGKRALLALGGVLRATRQARGAGGVLQALKSALLGLCLGVHRIVEDCLHLGGDGTG